MDLKQMSAAAACLLATLVAGCTSMPADYAATLPARDSKWDSAQCKQMRMAASQYKERKLYWTAGLLIGPYGLAIVAAGKEHQERQRKLFARDLHLRCSSLPLPKNLQIDPSITRKNTSG